MIFSNAGLGLGLINPSSFIAVNSYFTTKRGQAVGLALAGTGVGQMVMPHVVRLLLENYGFKGSTLILGALAFNGIVGATLYQPIKWHLKYENYVGENNMLLKPCDCDTDDEPCAAELTANNNNSRKDPAIKPSTAIPVEAIVLQPLSLKQRMSKAMDLQLLHDPVFVSIAIGLALAYTASTNFSMLFPYFLQVKMCKYFAQIFFGIFENIYLLFLLGNSSAVSFGYSIVYVYSCRC